MSTETMAAGGYPALCVGQIISRAMGHLTAALKKNALQAENVLWHE
jgi:hypothetical protein